MKQFTTAKDLIACCHTPENAVYASTAKFIESLTENERLSHAVQWLYRDRYIGELTDRIGEILKCKPIQSFNTYNWAANCSDNIQGFDFTYKGNDYCALQVHLGGDIRGAYSDLVVFEGSFISNVQDFYPDSTTVTVDGRDFSITPNLIGEYNDVYDLTTEKCCCEISDCDLSDIEDTLRERMQSGNL